MSTDERNNEEIQAGFRKRIIERLTSDPKLVYRLIGSFQSDQIVEWPILEEPKPEEDKQ